jgi:hypothetical protein
MDKINSRIAVVAVSKRNAMQAALQNRRTSLSGRQLLGVTLRALTVAVALSLPGFAPWTVRAQSALQPTQIVVGATAQPDPGSPITVQAVLADSQGHPISKAVIYFTAPASFLKTTGDIVLAQAVTNADGQAVAQFANDFSGTITLRAEFRGDAQYAPSNATVQAGAAAAGQVYVEHVGVDIPGFNVPPVVGGPRASLQSPQSGIAGFVQSLWPAMNGWPLAAVLLIVWSMYLFAVTFVYRVAKSGSESGESASTDSRSSL